MVDAAGVGGAGAFGALASTEEEVVEEEVDITFLPPKPKEKERAKEKEKKAAVKAAADAAEGAADSDSAWGSGDNSGGSSNGRWKIRGFGGFDDRV